MKIFFASDHAGFEIKKALTGFVKGLGFEVEDLGPLELNPDDDYPFFIKKAGLEIFKDPVNSKAIIIGGSGQGEAIVANRFPNVRAVVYYGGNKDIIKLSREHNDANILSLGARFISEKEGSKRWNCGSRHLFLVKNVIREGFLKLKIEILKII